MRDPGRWPAPWLFSLLILPLGIIVGFNFTPLPFLLAQAGIPVDRIASISTIVNLPAVLGVLIAPLVDTKFRRRTWIAIATFVTALSVCTYFPLIGAAHLKPMTALILLGGFPPFLIGAACGGMMAKLSQSAQSRAASWEMAGQLGGGAVAGALVLWLAARLPLAAVGLCIAVLIALPGFLSFAIPEPPPEAASWFRGRLTQMGKEAWSLIGSPARRWSTVLLVAPGGAGAAQSLLPAIASHYGVGATGVMWINGIGGGALLAVGSLSGALIPGDWDRRLTYAAAGLMNALATLVLLGANRPAAYLWGTGLYLITEGLCWARSTALMIEIVGVETRDAGTFYSVLNVAVSLPLLYMIRLDGWGFSKFGTRGLLWTDAAGNLLMFVVVAAVFLICGLGLRRPSNSRSLTGDAASAS